MASSSIRCTVSHTKSPWASTPNAPSMSTMYVCARSSAVENMPMRPDGDEPVRQRGEDQHVRLVSTYTSCSWLRSGQSIARDTSVRLGPSISSGCVSWLIDHVSGHSRASCSNGSCLSSTSDTQGHWSRRVRRLPSMKQNHIVDGNASICRFKFSNALCESNKLPGHLEQFDACTARA
jgi:hypothetical protein